MKLFLFMLVFVVALGACGRGNNNGDNGGESTSPPQGMPPAVGGAGVEPLPEPAPIEPEGPAEIVYSPAYIFLRQLMSGDYLAAYEMMCDITRAMLDIQTLAAIWQSVLVSQGHIVDFEMPAPLVHDGLEIYDIVVTHTVGTGVHRVVVDDAGKIAGFTNQGFALETIPPAADALYYAEEIVIGAGTDWALDGILTIPRDADAANPVPAVVLVHGSGAQNMDSSIFDNRPFHDIATYLSSHGIAVVRYNKRTLTHGMRFAMELGASGTVWEETVEDAILAADLLRADERIDSDRIFVAGLSLGGMLAPRIHVSGGDFAGLIIMSASPRSFMDISISQNMMSLEMIEDEEIRAAMMMQVQALAALYASVPYLEPEVAKTIPFAGGTTMYYLLDMERYPFAEVVAGIDVPILVLHGTHDFQTTAEEDFAAFESLFAVGCCDDITLNLYDGLNHLLMPSIAAGIMDIFYDYAIPGHVDAQVLRDIVEWVEVR